MTHKTLMKVLEMWRLLAIVAALSCGFTPNNTLSAADWGTLKGQITFTGKIPEVEVLQITRDEEVCGELDLVDESLVVNAKNRGLQNVVIWLSSRSAVPVHPSLAATPKPAVLDNKGCRFVPRIVRLRTDQVLQAVNADPIAHNVAVHANRNTPFSEVIPVNMPLEKVFQREELKPIQVDCSIHAWMRAWLVITEHPYSAVTDSDGNFCIPKLPYGTWEFRFWHERAGYLTSLQNGDERIELSRGAWQIDIDQAELTLGKLSVDQLTKK